jgi:hypothetical protein
MDSNIKLKENIMGLKFKVVNGKIINLSEEKVIDETLSKKLMTREAQLLHEEQTNQLHVLDVINVLKSIRYCLSFGTNEWISEKQKDGNSKYTESSSYIKNLSLKVDEKSIYLSGDGKQFQINLNDLDNFNVHIGNVIGLSESKLPVRCASFYGSKRFEEGIITRTINYSIEFSIIFPK